MRCEIDRAQAEAAWAILVEEAGARDGEMQREVFVRYVLKDTGDEYRFQGILGFGGKFRNNGNNGNVPYVDCYPEDRTPRRDAAVAATNARLRALFGGWNA